MKTFLLKISSPDGDLFHDSVVKISLRGMEGDLAVMAGHTPFVTSVKPCDCTIELENGDARLGFTHGGILNVSNKAVTFLTGSFNWK